MPLDPSERALVNRLAAKVAALEKQQRRSRTGAARYRSVDGGTMKVYDEAGNEIVHIGAQEDGTTGVQALNGAQLVADTAREGSITETEIADDSISTPKLQANAVTAEILAAEIALLSKLIIESDSDAALEIVQSDGTRTVLAASGSRFTGQGTFDALDVLGNLNIRGLTNYVAGLVTLTNGVSDPGQQAVVTHEYDTELLSGGGGFARRGLTDYALGPGLFVSVDTVAGGSTVQAWDFVNDVGYPLFAVLSGYQALGGITRIGNYYYVLARSAGNVWRIIAYYAPTQAVAGVWETSPSAGNGSIVTTADPAIGTDGTNVMIVWPQSDKLYVRRFNPATHATDPGEQTGNTVDCGAWSASTALVSVQAVDSKWFIGWANGVRAYTPGSVTATRDASAEWPLGAGDLRGMWHDLVDGWTTFHAGDKLYHYTDNEGVHDFAYTWVDDDPSGDAETLPSPLLTTAPRKYAKWRIGLPSLPPDDGTSQGANTAYLYAAPTGDTLIRQAELDEGDTSEVFYVLADAGTPPPIVSGFATRLETAIGRMASGGLNPDDDPTWNLAGDGSGYVGPYGWDKDGKPTGGTRKGKTLATIAGSSGQASVPHGLGVSPAWTFAQAYGTTAYQVFVTGTDATNITVTVRNVTTGSLLAAGTQVFVSWEVSREAS